MTKAEREEKKARTIECAQLIRVALAKLELQASVRCTFYVHCHDLINVHIKSKVLTKHTYKNAMFFSKGLEYWLTSWIIEANDYDLSSKGVKPFNVKLSVDTHWE